MRRGAAWLAEDLDRLEEHLEGFTGSVKVQVAGPWTVAAALESARGTRVVADPGTCRDLSQAVAAAVAQQVVGVRRRIPGAEVTVQVDEPMLPLVLAGRLRTPSGRGALRVPETAELSTGLARVESAARGAGATRVVAHCCAREVPFELLRRSGFQAVSVDVHVLGEGADEALGAWWDQGGEVALGVAPSVGPAAGGRPPSAEALARLVTALWGRIGFGVEAVGARTQLTPTCGLAGAAPDWARAVAPLLRQAAGLLESAD
jgi:methionine synthase II (cobalamin-independent)